VKIKNQRAKIKNTDQNSKILHFGLPFYILIFAFCILSSGCDAFVRKFTRKPKKEAFLAEEMVLVPEEYKGPQMTKEELYRQYFLFWKSWQDELIASLSEKRSQKKQIDCAEEAIKNLVNLKTLLNEEKQKELDIYIKRLKDLRDLISQDLYGSNIVTHLQKAEWIKRDILRNFSYHKVKDIL
jgi:hypothetical protein